MLRLNLLALTSSLALVDAPQTPDDPLLVWLSPNNNNNHRKQLKNIVLS